MKEEGTPLLNSPVKYREKRVGGQRQRGRSLHIGIQIVDTDLGPEINSHRSAMRKVGMKKGYYPLLKSGKSV